MYHILNADEHSNEERPMPRKDARPLARKELAELRARMAPLPGWYELQKATAARRVREGRFTPMLSGRSVLVDADYADIELRVLAEQLELEA